MLSEASVGRRIGTHLVLVFALSSYFYFLILRAGTLSGGGSLWVMGLMWCPGVSAIVASLLTQRKLSAIGWRWSWKYAGLAYAIPVAYGAVAYGATWALGLGGFPNADFLAKLTGKFGGGTAAVAGKFLFLQATVGVLVACASGLGEEIGWRGFLVPELSRRFSFARTSLISSAIWAVWHWPVLIFADYNAGTPTWYGLTCFTVMVLGIGFLFAWIRLASGSVWPAAILHASHNLWVQGVFDPLTSDTGRTKWIVTEFGAALALVSIAVAALVWARRGELPARAAEVA